MMMKAVLDRTIALPRPALDCLSHLVDAIVDSFVVLHRNPDLRKRHGAEGRVLYEHQFTLGHMIEFTVAVLIHWRAAH